MHTTHLPLPPPPPTLLHRVSQLPASESPPVSEAPAICSRKPGHQHREEERERGKLSISRNYR